MPAKGFYLRRNHTARAPATMIFVAVAPSVTITKNPCEARIHRFRAAYVVCSTLQCGRTTDRVERAFTSSDAFWSFLDKHRNTQQSTWVYGYNMGYQMTLLRFWEQLLDSADTVVGCCLEDPPFVVKVRRKGRLIHYVDALNYWNMPLWQLSQNTSCPLEQPAPGMLSLVPQPQDLPACARVVEEAILGLVGEVVGSDMCSWKPTAAALAWDCYFKSFNTQPILVHFHPKARALERKAYFGGRVQLFRRGAVHEPVSVYDANSLYPSVMATERLPSLFLNYKENPHVRSLETCLGDLTAVAHVRLVGGPHAFPRRHGGLVISTRGGCETWLCGEELKLALSAGRVRNVYSRALYRSDVLFDSYVKHWFRAKQLGRGRRDFARTATAKIMLNSLYGKFAQVGKRWSHDPQSFSVGPYRYWWEVNSATKSITRLRSIAGRVERQEGEDPGSTACVALSACVTAGGRCRLSEWLAVVGDQALCYTDTDSVHCIRPGPQRLAKSGALDPHRLGALRLECRVPNAYYYGRQHYKIGDQVVCSAIKPTAWEVANGLYVQEAVNGVQSTLESGHLDEVIVSARIVERNRRQRYVG